MEQKANGLFLLHKEAGMTSQTAVTRVRRLFGADKAGHTGTLDPDATGVLPVLIGRAVKASGYMLDKNKRYRALLRLGLTTDTEDATGKTLSVFEGAFPPTEQVLRTCASFVGEIRQVPPMYSALKRNGQKLVDLARRGVTVEREARTVTVFSLAARPQNEREYVLDVACSGGTYIRTLCADVGRALGTGGIMASLCRTEAAGFSLDETHTLAELEAMSADERLSLLRPVESLFSAYPPIVLPPFFERLARCGCEIYLKKIAADLPLGTLVRLTGSDGFFAVGEVRAYEDGNAVKPLTQFDL